MSDLTEYKRLLRDYFSHPDPGAARAMLPRIAAELTRVSPDEYPEGWADDDGADQ